MDTRYQRKDNESDVEYELRLVEILKTEKTDDLEWDDIKSFISFEGNKDSLRKANDTPYGGYAVYKYFKEKMEKLVLTDDTVLKEYELKKQELEKEKIKVQTEKLSLMQALREEARFELFIEHAVKAIKETKPILINNINNNTYTNNEDKSGLLLFADPHYGKELLIKGLYGEVINQYSISIFEDRMWKLLNKTIQIVKKEEFERISIFNLGDELDGILRISQLMTLKLGLVDSAIGFAYFLASWLNELSKHVYIDYYSSEGNHTDLRLLTGKKGDFPSENMSKIIQTLVGEILKDNPNITLHKNNTDKIFTNIQGYNVLGIHGEEKNIMQAIRDFSFIYNTQIDYICTGHKHHANSINAGINKGCIGVGSVIGVDDFSINLKKTSNPSATFAVFEKCLGKTIEYQICLN